MIFCTLMWLTLKPIVASSALILRLLAPCRRARGYAATPLLFGDGDQLVVGVIGEAERRFAAQILAPRLLRRLSGADTLADPVSLKFGEGGYDGEE